MKPWPRVVLHVDMDAFFAAVEQRDQPALRGHPVVVGGTGRRGVVSTASYEARRFGVKSAMPTYLARRLCPHAVFVAPRMGIYAAVSKRVMEILGRFSPTIEPLSLDEAFLDGNGTEALFGTPVEMAWKIQQAVKAELELSCAVGVATSKFVAKVASDQKKPGGIVVVQPGEERTFLAPMSVDRLWGVGPKTAERLRADGLETINDVARAPEATLVERYGSLGAHIAALARGDDSRPVDDEHERKSLGAERTLERDIEGLPAVLRELGPLVHEVAHGLRKAHLRAGGVRLKLKYADFHRQSRELMLPEPVQDGASLAEALRHLLDKADVDRPIRLVGLAATRLVDEGGPRQADLFDAEARERNERLGRALDLVQARFGADAVRRGEVARELDAIHRGNEHLEDTDRGAPAVAPITAPIVLEYEE